MIPNLTLLPHQPNPYLPQLDLTLPEKRTNRLLEGLLAHAKSLPNLFRGALVVIRQKAARTCEAELRSAYKYDTTR